jgi:hypothetical protein
MGQMEWWLAHSLWLHGVVFEYCKLEETPLCVASFLLGNCSMRITDNLLGCGSCCWYALIDMALDNSNYLAAAGLNLTEPCSTGMVLGR